MKILFIKCNDILKLLALKAMQLHEAMRSMCREGRGRRETNTLPVQLDLRRTTEQRRQRSSSQSGEKNNERVPPLKSETKVRGITAGNDQWCQKLL